MIECKLNPPESDRKIAEEKDSSESTNCKIFLGYTSNMASCGVRETIKFLAKHKMIDVTARPQECVSLLLFGFAMIYSEVYSIMLFTYFALNFILASLVKYCKKKGLLSTNPHLE